MIANPQPGRIVQAWYRAALRGVAPLHGREGVVEIVGRGRPRSHGVRIDGRLYVVPCGHLRDPNR